MKNFNIKNVAVKTAVIAAMTAPAISTITPVFAVGETSTTEQIINQVTQSDKILGSVSTAPSVNVPEYNETLTEIAEKGIETTTSLSTPTEVKPEVESTNFEVEESVVLQIEEIDFETFYEEDATLEEGQEKVKQEGVKGKIVNGIEVISPVNKIILKGSKPKPEPIPEVKHETVTEAVEIPVYTTVENYDYNGNVYYTEVLSHYETQYNTVTTTVQTPQVNTTVTPVGELVSPAGLGQYGANTYPVGQCTWGVKEVAPWAHNYWGNGADWAYSAAAAGFKTGHVPQVGAIASWNDGGYGHVAYVTHVDPSTGMIQVLESNVNGQQYVANHRGWFDPTAVWGVGGGPVTYIYPPAG